MYKKIIYISVGFLVGIAFVPHSFNNSQSTIQPKVLGIETNTRPEKYYKSPEISISLSPPVVTAKSALVFDLESDTILYSKDFDTQLPIASLTKLMTALVVLDKQNINNQVVVDHADTKVVGSAMGLTDGEVILVKDLLRGMLISSSNDATLALARSTTEDMQIFVDFMNQKAQDLKMTETNFTNPVGWDINDNYSTCLDLKKLVIETLKHDQLKIIFKTKETEVQSQDKQYNHKLLTTNKLMFTNPNIVGIKTGYTTKALGNLIINSRVLGTNIIVIILNSQDRENDAQKLLDWVYSVYRW